MVAEDSIVSPPSIHSHHPCDHSMLELRLSHTCTHDSSRCCAPGYHIDHRIDNVSATPLLMRQRLNTILALFTLDQLHVSGRSTLSVLLGEVIDAEGVGV